MNDTIQILGISGSLRRGSYNRAALRAAVELAPSGMTIDDSVDIGGLPLFNQDDEAAFPAAALDLKARIRAADAILIATPEYNYSVPGVLKNAIDWASRPYGDSAWNGKPVALMSASPGMAGGLRAQYHLRQSFVFLNMHPVMQPEVAIADAARRFDAEGRLTHEPTRQHIAALLASLARLTVTLRAGQLEPATA
jgi:chromate reductase, NAD(P)H dehydrogenase (quinone)